MTEITLKLHGHPGGDSPPACRRFPSVKAACDAVIATIQSGLPGRAHRAAGRGPGCAASTRISKLTLPETPLLLFEFHGTDAGVREQAERFGEICAEYEGGHFEWATKAEDRTRMWQARHDVYWASLGMRPGSKGVSSDVCVPISRLAECLAETKKDIEDSGLIAPIAGHVGDGNFHVMPLVFLDDHEEVARAEGFMHRLVERALAMEGTCTGEHGVGQGKMKYLKTEHGDAALDLMLRLKTAIDPDDIMNPGKILAA